MLRDEVVRGGGGDALRLDGLQQLAGGVVDVLRGARARGDARTRAVDALVGDGLRELAPEVVHIVRARGARPLGGRQGVAPCVHRRVGRRGGGAHGPQGVEDADVFDDGGALARGGVLVLGDAPFGAERPAQLAGGVVRVSRGERNARRLRARAVGIGHRPGRARQQLVHRAPGLRHRVARRIAGQRHVAVRVVGADGFVAERVGRLREAAVGVPFVGRALARAVDRRSDHAHEATACVVRVSGDIAQRIRDRGDAAGRVPAVGCRARDAVVRHLRHARHAPCRADLRVDEGDARAVRLRDPRDALARAVVGVGGDIGRAVGDGVVAGAQVDRDRGQPVARVVGIACAGGGQGRGAVEGDHAHERELVAAVVEFDPLAVRAGDRCEQRARVVAEGDRVEVDVLAADQPAAVGCVIGFDEAAGAVRPGPCRAAACQRVVAAVAVLADVLRGSRVVGVDELRAVLVHARDPAVRGVDRAHQRLDLPVETDAPVVVVVAVERALAVVGAEDGDVRPVRGEEVVLLLQHQVAGGRVDPGLLAAAPQRRVALPEAERGLRCIGQAEVETAHECDHAVPLLFVRPCVLVQRMRGAAGACA